MAVTACYLAYDIPDASGIPNPSGMLSGLGFRDQGSVWVLPYDDVPYDWIDRIREGGCKCRVVKFDAAESEQIAQMCIEALNTTVLQSIESITDRRATAEALLWESGDVVALKKYRTATRLIERSTLKTIENARRVAHRFGVDADTLMDSIRRCRETLSEAKAGMAERLSMYQAACSLIFAARGEGDPFAKAVRAKRVPAMVVADFLDDHEIGHGQAIRDMFAGW